MKYRVSLIGCDDSTHMLVDLTDDEAELIRRLAKLSEETSTFCCMPTLEIAAQADDE